MSVDAGLLSPELLARLESLELVSRKSFRGRLKGERRSLRRGQGVELADFRNYTPGDDLRFVDWNSYARLDRLFLKLFLEEEDLHFYGLLDGSGSMGFGTPTKFHYGKQLLAALGFIGLVRGDRVKIELLGSASEATPVFRGRRSLWPMLDYLEPLEPGPAMPLGEAVKRFCIGNSGKGIVVLVSDLLDKSGYDSALRYLTARSFDVCVVHILSLEEREPELQGDLRLVDCEDGQEVEITAQPAVLARYRRTLAEFTSTARDYCLRRGVMYVSAQNEIPVEQLVTGYLRQGGLVR
jgi:uncharacterized protein (DUF58 family)